MFTLEWLRKAQTFENISRYFKRHVWKLNINSSKMYWPSIHFQGHLRRGWNSVPGLWVWETGINHTLYSSLPPQTQTCHHWARLRSDSNEPQQSWLVKEVTKKWQTVLELGRTKGLLCLMMMWVWQGRVWGTMYTFLVWPVGGISFFHPRLPKGLGLSLLFKSPVTLEHVLPCLGDDAAHMT